MLSSSHAALLAPFIAKLAARDQLDADDHVALEALPVVEQRVDAGEYLIREGAVGEHCMMVLKGFVQRHKIVADGRRQIVAIHMEGDILEFGALAGLRANCHAQTLTAARILKLPTAALAAVIRARPSIAQAMWTESLTSASVFQEWLANIGRRDARSRMAHLLCELSLRQKIAADQVPASFDLPLTQEQLGDVLGLTSVHVNRTLKGLVREGLITYARARMTILRWNELASAGEFETGYLNVTGIVPKAGGSAPILPERAQPIQPA